MKKRGTQSPQTEALFLGAYYLLRVRGLPFLFAYWCVSKEGRWIRLWPPEAGEWEAVVLILP